MTSPPEVKAGRRNLDDVEFQTDHKKPRFGGAFLWSLVPSRRRNFRIRRLATVMETIGLWIIAGVVSLSLTIPVGLVLYLAYQTWRGDLREDDEI